MYLYFVFFHEIQAHVCLFPESQNDADGNEAAETPNQAASPAGRGALAVPLLGLGGGPGSETRARVTLWDSYRINTLAIASRVKVGLTFCPVTATLQSFIINSLCNARFDPVCQSVCW